MNVHDIQSALRAATMEGKNQVFTEARGDAWKKIGTSEYHRLMLDELKTGANGYLGEPIPCEVFSKYKLFDTTGDRDQYQAVYFNKRGRLAHFAAMALLDGGEAYISALEDTIWAICNEYTWCLPAHLGWKSLEVIDRLNKQSYLDVGYTGKSIREHHDMVDLFASETGFAIAETLSLLGDRLHPLVVDRAKKEILSRIIEPYMAINEPFGWESGTGNWTAVCAGSVGSAAIYMISDDSALASVLRRVTDSMERYLLGFSEEGVCTEGTGYWTYGFTFYTCFAELLYQRTGGRIELMKGERVRNIATFIQRAHIQSGIFPWFSDVGLSETLNIGLFEHLKRKFPEVVVPAIAYREGTSGDHCYRFCKFLRSFVWATGQAGDPGNPSGDTVFADAQWAISRSNESGAAAFACKGGHNAEPHNQNDVGSFMLLSKGEVLFPDPGRGRYTRQYFSPTRYTFFNAGSQGHSVPMVDGGYQKGGQEYAATSFNAASSERAMTVSMDIAGAYGVNALTSIRREMMFDRDTNVFTLIDAFSMSSPAGIVERIIAASVKKPLIESGKITVFGRNTSAELEFDAGAFGCEIKNVPEDAWYDVPGFTLYAIDFTAKSKDGTPSFRASIGL